MISCALNGQCELTGNSNGGTQMSIKSIIGAGTVLLLLGAVPSVYGQRDPQGDKGQGQQCDQAAPQQNRQPASRPAHPTARPAAPTPAQPTARPAAPTPPQPAPRPAPVTQRT